MDSPFPGNQELAQGVPRAGRLSARLIPVRGCYSRLLFRDVRNKATESGRLHRAQILDQVCLCPLIYSTEKLKNKCRSNLVFTGRHQSLKNSFNFCSNRFNKGQTLKLTSREGPSKSNPYPILYNFRHFMPVFRPC